MSDLSPLGLISTRQDRLERRIKEVGEETEQIAILETKVDMLTETVNRNTSALYTAAISLIVTGVLGVVTALILKGVLG